MEKTTKRSQTSRGDHLVAVFELDDRRGHRKGGRRSSRFCVQTDFRIPDVRAVCRYCGVVAFIEDGVETDRSGHDLHMGRNVLWNIIGVPNLRRQNALDLRLNFNVTRKEAYRRVSHPVHANRCCTGSAEDVLPPPPSHTQSAHLLTHSLSSGRIILHFLANHRSSRTTSVNKSKYADEANLLYEWCNLVTC